MTRIGYVSIQQVVKRCSPMSLIPLLFHTTCLSEWTLLISWDLFRVKKYLLNVYEVLSTMLSSVEGIEANSELSFCLQGVNYSATEMEYIYLCNYFCCCLVTESHPTLLQPHAFHLWLARHLCPHIYVYFICMAYICVCVLYICVCVYMCIHPSCQPNSADILSIQLWRETVWFASLTALNLLLLWRGRWDLFGLLGICVYTCVTHVYLCVCVLLLCVCMHTHTHTYTDNNKTGNVIGHPL